MYTLVEADLLFIMGTSLTVYPFAALSQIVSQDCPRVLINFDGVGDLGERLNDVLLLDDCDDTVQKLCEALGWDDELKNIWEAAKETLEIQESAASDSFKQSSESGSKALSDLQKQVEELTEKVGIVLNVAEGKSGEETTISEKHIESSSASIREANPEKDDVDTQSKTPTAEQSSKKDPDSSVDVKNVTKL